MYILRMSKYMTDAINVQENIKYINIYYYDLIPLENISFI